MAGMEVRKTYRTSLTTMNPEQTKKYNAVWDVCLKNAEDLLKASKLALDGGIDHVSFHLSALAMEEVGKTFLLFVQAESEEIERDEEKDRKTAELHSYSRGRTRSIFGAGKQVDE